MDLLEEKPLLLTDEVKDEEISQQPIVLSPAAVSYTHLTLPTMFEV